MSAPSDFPRPFSVVEAEDPKRKACKSAGQCAACGVGDAHHDPVAGDVYCCKCSGCDEDFEHDHRLACGCLVYPEDEKHGEECQCDVCAADELSAAIDAAEAFF
jgi:hypothetical protein